jgi:AhpD family alkylhydroperoxidase
MRLSQDYNKLAPEANAALTRLQSYVQDGLGRRLCNLVFIRASQINGCGHSLDVYTRDALEDGEDPVRLGCLPGWREVPAFFDGRERAALAWTESATLLSQSCVPDEDFEPLRRVFSEREIVDLTLAIGLINSLNRLAVGFHVPPVKRHATPKLVAG